MKASLRLAIYVRDNGVCGICSMPVTPSDFSVDHIVPRYEGGPDTVENLRTAHISCNCRRPRPGFHPRRRYRRRADAVVDTHLRLPSELADALKVCAEQDGRSLNSEIVVALREWLEYSKKKRR